MAWVYLLIAALFEVVWAISLKQTNGFTRITPSILTISGIVISFYFLACATKTLPIGTAYAIWTGIGAVGVAILEIIFLGEPINPYRIIFLILIIAGVVGFKFLGQ
ncbi:small multidrug resistance protein [Desulfofarcimen acetoxidans DSM 771]|jgi:quaternary ammonium compound-resistance protein SugE|uniref:Small multidrug resistance protein n=1 Tax=Desulfofarcimen acetoxidans (strain ATCC 49208 / DSM 771 / KCTC 5769 / VKM B-1644 / 5575) TaxID=485916 RepID=C8W6L8_DESAS|nr:quaternary ammonium compound efflux SMR transporter SugE [Desulfofarcimen acetoxidans]ACV64127.1 small multidrug resistance protein [Desulfofarcimen acetoxidans DSM 771]